MRILYDHQAFSRQKYGGVSRYIYELASRVPIISGDESEVFAPLFSSYLLKSFLNRSSGICLPKFRGSAVSLDMINAWMGKLLVAARKDVDIFHETYYTSRSYCPPAAKRIVTVHDMIHELFPESFSKLDRTTQNKRRAVLRADHVICNSESTRRDLLQFIDIPPEKTSVIHLGHSLSNVDEKNPVKGSLSKPYLLYVGNRGEYKNFNRLLRAYAQSGTLNNNFSLVCFGGGKATPDEKKEIAMLGVQEKILFTAGPDAALAHCYVNASAFIYPSLYEGFGIPPLEAMSYRCPVVCSNTSSIPEVVADAAEFFHPHSCEDITSAIERVVGSTERTEQLICNGLARIQHFTWDRCAKATLRQYAQCTQ